MNHISSVIEQYKLCLRNKRFLLSTLFSFVLLVAVLIFNFYAATYATRIASNPVTDIVLSNIPVFDVDGFFLYGFMAFCLFSVILCLLKPKEIPFVFKNVALFVFIRAIFLTLTHIGPYPSQLLITFDSTLLKGFIFSGDLFFSAHTGLPFLMALIFWKNVYLRVLFIVTSFFFGAIVLLGHIHYSIDVLAAFFITDSIYHLAERFFKKDLQRFNQT